MSQAMSDSALLGKLAQAGLTERRQILEKCDTQLIGLLGCSLERLKALRLAVGGRCEGQNSSQMTREAVATGFDTLDEALGDGLRVGWLTELAGPAGSGKTQCCLQAAALCARTADVVVLDAEGSFRAERLFEIARARGWAAADADVDRLLRRVHVSRPKSVDELRLAIRVGETKAAETRARLLIVDSIAALVRVDFSADELRDRQAYLADIASELKRIARSRRLAVLVTNHVRADFEKDTLEPTLGLIWYHSVTTRLLFEPAPAGPGGIITVVKSPAVPRTSVAYAILTQGLDDPPPGEG